MSRARQVLPEQFYLITRSCTQRMFLLRPDATTTNSFLYCLVEAANRFDIDVLMTTAESNHHHTVIFDRHRRYPQFIEHFHKMFARCQNARLGRWENLWASEEPCITRLLDRTAVIDKLVYVAGNPVKDSLVERATQWPGANGYRYLLAGKPLQAERPRFFFDPRGAMPEVVSRGLTIPACLGPADEVIAEVRERITQLEDEMRAHRAKTGARVVGRHRVLTQPWHGAPSSSRPHRNLRPRFAGRTEVRVAALIAYREFACAYRDARRAWLQGAPPRFPPGTYWLARFAPITLPT